MLLVVYYVGSNSLSGHPDYAKTYCLRQDHSGVVRRVAHATIYAPNQNSTTATDAAKGALCVVLPNMWVGFYGLWIRKIISVKRRTLFAPLLLSRSVSGSTRYIV